IGTRMKRIALQSAVGGMLLSLGGMLLAATGGLTPVAGALLPEVIDVLAVLNALRVASPGTHLTDYEQPPDGQADKRHLPGPISPAQ
ncbi:MAG: heavy metal translocating P-type ATPase, partial [Planctomycetaceae bacterium]